MSRFDMSALEWSFIEPLLPQDVRGVARVDDRRVINGIFYKLRTGLPLRFHLTPGQDHDAPACHVLLQKLQPNQYVLADKAYDADWIRGMIYDQGAIACIPYKSNRKCPGTFDKMLYKKRNLVERFFGRIKKSFRSIATRYEKYATNFMAMIKIASIRLWCEFYESTT